MTNIVVFLFDRWDQPSHWQYPERAEESGDRKAEPDGGREHHQAGGEEAEGRAILTCRRGSVTGEKKTTARHSQLKIVA